MSHPPVAILFKVLPPRKVTPSLPPDKAVGSTRKSGAPPPRLDSFFYHLYTLLMRRTSRKTTPVTDWTAAFLLPLTISLVLLVAAACPPTSTPSPSSPTPTDPWAVTLLQTPYPYSTPLPPPQPSPLDGIFSKLDPRQGQRAPCRRCPPYPPEGGLWLLHLDNGIFRVFHQPTGWRTIGSFTASDNQMAIFNDPHCPDTVGIYTWTMADGNLIFSVIEDSCGGSLRAKSFTALPWMNCQPPSTEAAITNHWPIPPGCPDSHSDFSPQQ